MGRLRLFNMEIKAYIPLPAWYNALGWHIFILHNSLRLLSGDPVRTCFRSAEIGSCLQFLMVTPLQFNEVSVAKKVVRRKLDGGSGFHQNL